MIEVDVRDAAQNVETSRRRVLAAREFAIPDRRMIRLADELLGREGRLIAAVEKAME